MSEWIAQNGTQYEVVLSTSDGTRLATIDNFVSLNYAKVANDIGSFSIALPSTFDVTLLDKDKMISVWRKPIGGIQSLDFRGFVLGIFEREEANGIYTITASGAGLNHLLKRRIIAYAAQTTYTDKTDNVDDMMKAIVRENLGALATDTDRAIPSTLFSVQDDLGLGDSLSRAFSYKNMLSVLRDLAQASRTDDPEIFFDIVPISDSTLEFKTFKTQPGSDLRGKFTFGRRFGNLGWAQYDQDWKDFGNLIYCMGTGDGLSREVIVAYLTAAEPSGIGRTEVSRDARNDGFTAMLLAAAAAQAQEVRPVRHFQGQALSVPGSVYGTDWRFGDYVGVTFRGKQFNCIIRAVSVTLNQDRSEEVSALLEAYV